MIVHSEIRAIKDMHKSDKDNRDPTLKTCEDLTFQLSSDGWK